MGVCQRVLGRDSSVGKVGNLLSGLRSDVPRTRRKNREARVGANVNNRARVVPEDWPFPNCFGARDEPSL